MDTTEGQDFVFTVSVEGHGEYPTEKVLEDPEIVVSGVEDEGERNAWEYYVNLVHAMDEFAGDLVRAVEERNEPTVLVFYGDHLPTMNLEAKDLKSRYLYNTNYVIWDNIGLEKKDGNVAAYQVMADVFERLDIHAGTVFNYHPPYEKLSGRPGTAAVRYHVRRSVRLRRRRFSDERRPYVYGRKRRRDLTGDRTI